MVTTRPRLWLNLIDPHENEALEALARPGPETPSSQEMKAYWLTFFERLDEYRASAKEAMPGIDIDTVIAEIAPLAEAGCIAGMEVRLPPTVAAAVFSWVAAGAFLQHQGAMQRFSPSGRARRLVADVLYREAARTLAAGPGDAAMAHFLNCFGRYAKDQDAPNFQRACAINRKKAERVAWRVRWDALEASYDEGDVDWDDFVAGKNKLLDEHP